MESLEDRKLLATFTVNTLGDAGNGFCNTSGCTLRDAILAANGAPGPDTIHFAAGVTGSINLPSLRGELSITDDVTIIGPGPDKLTVRAQASLANQFRVFDMESSAGDVTLSGMTITGGFLDIPAGAGIRFQSTGTLTIRDSVITGNTANNGAGVYSEFGGNLDISSSSISGNTAMYGDGGGIHNEDGNTTITASDLSDNQSFGGGAGLFSPYAGIVTITDSTLVGNRVTQEGYHGGAVYSGEGDVTISGSTISGNTAGDDGGGLYNISGNVSITSTQFTNNRAGYSGGGIFHYQGAMTLRNVTVAGNVAAYADGGGIGVDRGNVTITRSTVSGNSAVTDGGGIATSSGTIDLIDALLAGNRATVDGGGIATATGAVTLTNSTISGNTANENGGGVFSDSAAVRLVNSTMTLNYGGDSGGGIGVQPTNSGESILLHNTIVAQNTSPIGPDLLAPGSTANLQVRSSLVSSNADTGLNPARPDLNGNFIGSSAQVINAGLAPLSNNGGITQTHALSGLSDAIDRGDNSLAVTFGPDRLPGGGDDVALTTDQRGGLYQRIVNFGGGFRVDMGALETQSTPQFIVDTNEDAVDGNVLPGDRSLRELIEIANETPESEVITFQFGLAPIQLDPALGEIVVSDSLTIDGPGANAMTIGKDPAEPFRLFRVSGATDLRINGVTLTGGNADQQEGGAILSGSSGNVQIVRSRLTGNTAVAGGAIAATAGSLSVVATTIDNNDASSRGGAIFSTGASASLEVIDSTITGNTATLGGGGIYSEDTPILISSSTITNNVSGTTGGGIGFQVDSGGESLDLVNSIVANNTAALGPDFIAPGLPSITLDVRTSLVGNNLSTTLTATGSQADPQGNFVGSPADPVDPMLGPLGDNGGPLPTQLPLEGSRVIDSANASFLPIDALDLDHDNNAVEGLPEDQRGAARVVDGLDMGAVELGAVPDITWNDPADIVFGTLLGPTQLNAMTAVPGSFQYTPPQGSGLGAGAGQILTAVFTPDDPLAFRSRTVTASINVLKATPAITWNDPAPIEFGTPLSGTQLNADADVDGTFVYDPVAGTVLNVGMHTLTSTFTPTDTENYNSVVTDVMIEVDLATPVVTWNDPAPITFGTALNNTQLNATADVDGTFAYSPIAGTVLLAGDGQVLSVTFTPDNPNFRAVTETVSIDVAKADPVITWADPDDIIAGTPLSATQLNATANVDGTFVYQPPEGTVLQPGDNQQLMVTFTPDDTANYNVAVGGAVIDVLAAMDYGDAPLGYPVLLAQDGARHIVGDLKLGADVDVDLDGQPSAAADGDGADDDGIQTIADAVAGGGSATTSSFVVNASDAGRLDAWVDYNGDGDWDDIGEQIVRDEAVNAGNNVISYNVLATAVPGDTAARFRLSSAGGLSPTGQADDGEVEDYLVTLLDGSTSPDVVVRLVDTTTLVSSSSGRWTVSDGVRDLFSAPLASVGSLQVRGSDGDDVLSIELGAETNLLIDGGGGVNTLVVDGDSVDLTAGGNLSAQRVHQFDLTGVSEDTFTIDATSVAALSPTDSTIVVFASVNDELQFDDGADWRMDDPRVDGNDFFLRALNQLSGEVVELESPTPWQNPIEPSDVDNGGTVTAGDALRIINELSRRSVSDADTQNLTDPLPLAEFPGVYYDQNGDNRATALDALRVINRLAVLGSGEGESLPAFLDSASEEPAFELPVADVGMTVGGSEAVRSPWQASSVHTEVSNESAADSDDQHESWRDRVDDFYSQELSIQRWF